MTDVHQTVYTQGAPFSVLPCVSFMKPTLPSYQTSILPSAIPSHSLPQGNSYQLSPKTCLHFLECYIRGNIHYVLYLFWLFSQHNYIKIQAVMYINGPFIFIAEKYFTVWTGHNLLIHSPAGVFLGFPITSKVTMNMYKQIVV